MDCNMVKLISIAIFLTTLEFFITDPCSAQGYSSSVMEIKAEVIDGLSVQMLGSSSRFPLDKQILPYGVFSLRAASGTEVLISSKKKILMQCDKESWTLDSDMMVRKFSNGAMVLRFIAGKDFEKRRKGLHTGIQSLTIEYL
jgi:hypothetical protein